MKKRIIIWSLLFLMIQVFKSYLMMDYGEAYGKGRIEIALNGANKICYKNIILNDAYSIYLPILMNQVTDVTCKGSETVNVIGTTFNAAQLERLKIVDGAFWGEEACLDARNTVVISGQLAILLFGSEKVSGNIIHLNKEPYESVGVYKKYSKIRDYIMDDGCEKVYVPITSGLTKSVDVQLVSIDGTYLESMPMQEDLEKMGLGVGDYETISHQETWFKEMVSVKQIPMIVLWLAFSLFGGKIIYTYVRKRGRKILLKELGKESIVIIFYIAGVALLYRLSFETIYIRASALPQENIFDVVFYWKALKEEWIRHNQFLKRDLSNFEQAIYLLKFNLHTLNIIQYACLIKIGCFIRHKWQVIK